jgi:hypothetical protein
MVLTSGFIMGPVVLTLRHGRMLQHFCDENVAIFKFFATNGIRSKM